MAVHRIYLESTNGNIYKYERKPICDEMPHIKLKSKKWFLWQQTFLGWRYIGYYNTKTDMLREGVK